MRRFRAHIRLEGRLICRSALHVGAFPSSLEVRGVDLPTQKRRFTGQPTASGSALRGKLKFLLEKATFNGAPGFFQQVAQVDGRPIHAHTCPNAKCRICRLFGPVPTKASGGARPFSPLMIDDLVWLSPTGSGSDPLFEVKTEIVVDRGGESVMPRMVERVPPAGYPAPGGTQPSGFRLGMSYFVIEPDNLAEDIETLLWAFALLEDDSLGGHGARGSGAVTVEWELLQTRSRAYYATPSHARDGLQMQRPWKPALSTPKLQAVWGQLQAEISPLWKEA